MVDTKTASPDWLLEAETPVPSHHSVSLSFTELVAPGSPALVRPPCLDAVPAGGVAAKT